LRKLFPDANSILLSDGSDIIIRGGEKDKQVFKGGEKENN